METTSDKTRAYLYALAVHVLVFAALFIGLLWTSAPPAALAPGAIIEAEIVGATQAPKANAAKKPSVEPPKQAESKPEPEPPKPEPPKPEPPKPEPPKPQPPKPVEAKAPAPTVQHNDTKDQEKIDETALLKAEKADKAQEEKKKKQKQIELEEQKREEEEAKQKQKEQQEADAKEAEKQKQLKAIRDERAANAKRINLERERLAQLDDRQKQLSQSVPGKPAPATSAPEGAVAKTGMEGTDPSRQGAYYSAIQLAVTNNWLRPDNAAAGLTCRVHIIQIPGGTVLSATVVPPCNVDQATRTSIQQAVMKASPLPYQSYEKEFKREINFDFTYGGG